MRPIVAAAAGLLLFAGSEIASAGTITPTQYAYGGGSNAAAVIVSQPPAATGGQSADAGGATPASGGDRSKGRHVTTTTPPPLVGIATSPATPVASFGAALNRAIPVDALWAIALAIACALGAWLLRRGRGTG